MENTDYTTKQLITYYGNKRKLLDLIGQGIDVAVGRLGRTSFSFLDGFAGSGVVSRSVKSRASKIHSNDLERYSETIARCYLTNASEVDLAWLSGIADELEKSKNRDDLGPGLISRLYAPEDDTDIKRGERGFFTTENALIIDNIRRTIDELVEPEQRHLFIAPLLSQASTHVNSPGHFGGFYKNSKTGIAQFGGDNRDYLRRITPPICAEAPVLSNYDCESAVHRMDTNALVRKIEDVDIAYFDPPYSRLIYGQFYFLLNVIDEYIEPKNITDVAGRPRDWNRSNYNSISGAKAAMTRLMRDTPAKFILMSYSNEGLIPHDVIMGILEAYGSASVAEKSHDAYRRGGGKRKGKPKTAERLYILEKHL